jgi:hypothetical protein
MSSAILYLAIVAIWACVLIPRWLRRDSARGAAAPATFDQPAPAEPDAPAADVAADEAGESDDLAPPAPLSGLERAADSRRHMLAARRRLLLMLIGLEVAAIALAAIGLAAVWVVVPPTIMLGGYLLLLREAAQADTERAQRDAVAAARERARARSQAPRFAQAGQVTPAEGTSTEGVAAAAAALAAKFAAAPVPADYEDTAPGRDFAPGLAGKYTTSNADAEAADEDYYDTSEAADEDYYDTYEVPPLRAVGD